MQRPQRSISFGKRSRSDVGFQTVLRSDFKPNDYDAITTNPLFGECMILDTLSRSTKHLSATRRIAVFQWQSNPVAVACGAISTVVCLIILFAKDKLGQAYKWILLVLFIFWVAGMIIFTFRGVMYNYYRRRDGIGVWEYVWDL